MTSRLYLADLYSADTPLGAFENSSQPGHGWHSYTKGTSSNISGWNGTWTVRSGYLGAGNTWGNSSKQNATLDAAEQMCSAASDCAGFCFNDFEPAPSADKDLTISFKKSATNFVAEHSVGLQPSPIPAPGAPGNQKPNQPGAWAYDSQSTYILPNPHARNGSSTKIPPFIYIGDRWNFTSSYGTSTATYLLRGVYI